MVKIRNILDTGYKIVLEIQKTQVIFPIDNWAHCQFLPGREKKQQNTQVSNKPVMHLLLTPTLTEQRKVYNLG